jgi:sterol desaturase/sphingolipid hydroxylase (fatty acid hydroxylase superfamily)
LAESALLSLTTFHAWTFYGAFLVAMIWESAAPAFSLASSMWRRWMGNITLGALTIGAVALTPLSSIAVAVLCAQSGFGVLNAVAVPEWAGTMVAILALDLVKYGEHYAFHLIPLAWRAHLVHHADPDVDVATALRHHPFEGAVSLAVTLAAVALIGASPIAVVIFEAAHGALDSITHANVRLPAELDRALRWIFVTPGMHRIHHSAAAVETDSNFGTLFSFWDRLFDTYRLAPAGGYERMRLGLDQYRDRKLLGLHWLLILPFLSPDGGVRPRTGEAV